MLVFFKIYLVYQQQKTGMLSYLASATPVASFSAFTISALLLLFRTNAVVSINAIAVYQLTY